MTAFEMVKWVFCLGVSALIVCVTVVGVALTCSGVAQTMGDAMGSIQKAKEKFDKLKS